MKDALETMEILAAYDLTESLRGAADLAGCSSTTPSRRRSATATTDVHPAPGPTTDGSPTRGWKRSRNGLTKATGASASIRPTSNSPRWDTRARNAPPATSWAT